jgi:hypothetical protein
MTNTHEGPEQHPEAPAVVDVNALIEKEAQEWNLPLEEFRREVQREVIARCVKRVVDGFERACRGPDFVTW